MTALIIFMIVILLLVCQAHRRLDRIERELRDNWEDTE